MKSVLSPLSLISSRWHYQVNREEPKALHRTSYENPVCKDSLHTVADTLTSFMTVGLYAMLDAVTFIENVGLYKS